MIKTKTAFHMVFVQGKTLHGYISPCITALTPESLERATCMMTSFTLSGLGI